MARRGANVVVGVGFAQASAMEKVVLGSFVWMTLD